MNPDRDMDGRSFSFTRRTGWDRTPNPLEERRRALVRSGRALIDLTESNPTRAGIAYPEAGIRSAIGGEGALRYDPDPRGMRSAREAVAGYETGRGRPADPGALVLTASTSEAYAWLFKLLCEEGDAVLAPSPSYPLLDFLARAEGVRLDRYPLAYEAERWRLDGEALEQAAAAPAAGGRARAIVVVEPNNPTGSMLDALEWRWLRTFAARRGMAVIVDQVFADYLFEEARPGGEAVGAADARGNAGDVPLLFRLGGLSKTAGLPQVKLSWIAVEGPAAVAAEALDRLEILGDTFLSVGTPVQSALPRLLELGEGVQARILERVRRNRAALVDTARGAARSGWVALAADGGWYSIVRLPRILSEEEWAMTLLERDSVHVHPGYLFDFEDEAYVVVSLLPEPRVFDEGIGRIARRVEAVVQGT